MVFGKQNRENDVGDGPESMLKLANEAMKAGIGEPALPYNPPKKLLTYMYYWTAGLIARPFVWVLLLGIPACFRRIGPEAALRAYGYCKPVAMFLVVAALALWGPIYLIALFVADRRTAMIMLGVLVVLAPFAIARWRKDMKGDRFRA